jgi:hypothetical protein
LLFHVDDAAVLLLRQHVFHVFYAAFSISSVLLQAGRHMQVQACRAESLVPIPHAGKEKLGQLALPLLCRV